MSVRCLRSLQRRHQAKKRFEYVGVKDCLSATKVAAGPLECAFGCLGFGSCVAACKFGAMSIGPNGTAVWIPTSAPPAWPAPLPAPAS